LVEKAALIIGSNIAGVQAALDFADIGIKVHLIDSRSFMSGSKNSIIPNHFLNKRMLEVARHPKINVWTNSQLNRIEGEDGKYFVELRHHPRFVDLSRCTACGECIKVCPVTVPGTDQKAIQLDGQPSCATIKKLGKSPCSNTCPGGIHVQGYIALIAQGRFQEAIDLIRQAIPFPGICGRVCTHPCEVNCRRTEIDNPVSVRLLKRFVSDWELDREAVNESSLTKDILRDSLHSVDEINLKYNPAKTTNMRVAIIGAGPGGMSVANSLAQMDYQVTVFEKLPVIGGMMTVGIPEYRLPYQIITRELQNILDLGVEIRLNTSIGGEGKYDIDSLFDMDFKAVCLAIGAHRSQSLDIPGEDLEGVIHGIDLLKIINFSQRLRSDNLPLCLQYESELRRTLIRGEKTKIGILGGGNTAMDVSRSLRRLGLQSVTILYRRTRNEMPAMPEEIEDAIQEGVKFEFLVSPVRVLSNENGIVQGLECIRMKLGEPDTSSRRRPVPIAGSEFVLDLDLVVLAIGQAPDFNCLGKTHGLAITRDERINVSEVTFMTNRKGVFAVGDAVTSDKMVVIEAIGMGKKAAEAIDSYLHGKEPHDVVLDARKVPIAQRNIIPEDIAQIPRTLVPCIPINQRTSSFSEIELGYTAEQAIAEARRCLVCGPCSECMACVQVCKPGAIIHDQHETFSELEIGPIIIASNQEYLLNETFSNRKGVNFISADDARLGSAAVARAMVDLGYRLDHFKTYPISNKSKLRENSNKIGVFLCQCGEEISEVIDFMSVREALDEIEGVIFSREIPFSCSTEAANVIIKEIENNNLDEVILAACSCCTFDQICYSCTYQRLRCKQNLGIFGYPEPLGDQIKQNARFGLVNIREQCSWVHSNNKKRATEKATALVAAAIARTRGTPFNVENPESFEKSVLILGEGEAAHTCQAILEAVGVKVSQLKALPEQIRRYGGQYEAHCQGVTWRASGLVICPENIKKSNLLAVAFGEDRYRPRIRDLWGGLETHRPGIYYCSPELESISNGEAVAARMIAWMGRKSRQSPIAPHVDTVLCRACGTCVDICEFGAAVLVEDSVKLNKQSTWYSWIDPIICTGCNTCVAHCPSGAISAGLLSDSQLENMICEILMPSDLRIKYGQNRES